MKRPNTALGALVAVMLLACGVTIVLPLMSMSVAEASCAPKPLTAPSTGGGDWSQTARQHAATIVVVGGHRGLPARGLVIAVATAMQESGLRNLANTGVPRSLEYPHDGVGHDHDSVGLFQQRPSPPDGQGAWGEVADLMAPAISAGKFYTALAKVPNWQTMRLTDAAQAVQRSAFPEAYQKWEESAEQLVAAILGVGAIEDIGGGPPLAPCGTADIDPVQVGPNGWVQPVRAKIGSPYGQRGGRLHAGVDLGAARHTPIRAASAGVVVRVKCNSSTGTCDRDGSLDQTGCGWYVDVRHAVAFVYAGVRVTSVVTRYCHMVQRPQVAVGEQVAAGTVLGFVGSSGRSSGPHLHFQVHLNVPAGGAATNANSTDPVPFMEAVGAKLGPWFL
ncbi:M23 family metallopeptidase [Catellatospora sp. NPDC049133]|uniref:M23 family metallopeptidase n=1 Tax=Catellatospora sp. NPDC049133 TaxID=3155499 RepID=UPI0033E12FD4